MVFGQRAVSWAAGIAMAVGLGASADAAPVQAVPTNDFLDSIGIVTTFPDRGQPVEKTIEMIKYCGFRWVRGGIEGMRENGPTTIQTYIDIHKATGVKFNFGLVSGGSDIQKLLEGGRKLAEAGALLAFEGNNEPNNWGVTYQGEKGGGQADSWLAVAKLQRDMYQAIKSDPVLKDYPVWSISEPGAQKDNCGLQFLEIPEGADTLMPPGTKYADYANCHNYFYHPKSKNLKDNRTWNAADPSPACMMDGLHGNFGVTWLKKFRGYSQAELDKLPRVTTETGCTIEPGVTEEDHAIHLTNVFLAQFKRGWSYTSPYLLRDRTDEGGNQKFGYFNPDYTPRKAAHYLHNLTTILADNGKLQTPPASLDYSIPNQPETVHDLLLQHSSGAFQLVIWGEKYEGTDTFTVKFGSKQPKITIYDNTVGTEPVRTVHDVDSLELTTSRHPLILKIER